MNCPECFYHGFATKVSFDDDNNKIFDEAPACHYYPGQPVFIFDRTIPCSKWRSKDMLSRGRA